LELAAPGDWPDAVEPLGEEVGQGMVERRVRKWPAAGARPLRDDAGRPERADPALARSHAQPGPAPDVVEAARPVLLEERVERVPGDHLALAAEGRVPA